MLVLPRGNDNTLLATSLHRFVGTTGYDLNALRTDLARFTFLLAPTTAPNSSAPTSHNPHREATPPGARTGDHRWGQIT